MLGRGTPTSVVPIRTIIEPVLTEETVRTRTAQGQQKPKVFKIQKIIGKTPEPSKLPGSGLSTDKLINLYLGSKNTGSF